MSLTLRTEDDAGDGGDVGLLKKLGCDAPAVFVNLADAGKGVKGAGRQLALEAEVVEAVDEEIAALAILFTTGGNRILGNGESFERGPLGGCGDAVRGVEHELAQAGNRRFFGHGIAGAPTGHG